MASSARASSDRGHRDADHLSGPQVEGACEASGRHAQFRLRVREGAADASHIITATRAAIEAEGIRLLFGGAGAPAGIPRGNARIDPSEAGAEQSGGRLCGGSGH
jgi:hypothetical protein